MKWTNQQTYLWACITWALIILILCTLPSSGLPKAPFIKGADKVVHALLYFILTFLALKWGVTSSLSFKKSMLCALIGSICYGIVIEFIQGQFLPSRSFEINDIFANISGSILAILFLKINK